MRDGKQFFGLNLDIYTKEMSDVDDGIIDEISMVFYGQSRSGKSALLRNIVDEIFLPTYSPTITDIQIKILNKKRLKLLECGGNIDDSLSRSFIQKSSICVFVFDPTRDASKQNEKLSTLLRTPGARFDLYLVTTKKDLLMDEHQNNINNFNNFLSSKVDEMNRENPQIIIHTKLIETSCNNVSGVNNLFNRISLEKSYKVKTEIKTQEKEEKNLAFGAITQDKFVIGFAVLGLVLGTALIVIGTKGLAIPVILAFAIKLVPTLPWLAPTVKGLLTFLTSSLLTLGSSFAAVQFSTCRPGLFDKTEKQIPNNPACNLMKNLK